LEFEIDGIRTIYEGWTKFLLVAVRTPEGGLAQREVGAHQNAACVLPYDPGRRVAILVRQFRAPVRMAGIREDIFEAIAGMLDGGAAEETARREAMEEAGLRIGALEPAGLHWTAPGISTERMALFLAPYGASDRIGDGGGLASEHEKITIVEMPLDALARLADNGELNDLKTFALVQTLRLRRPELFGL
jgi:nudix-type nucleoside diphosphatase (YffH/AdpP family)